MIATNVVMRQVIRYSFCGLVGAFFGYMACIFAANIEGFQFFTIRKWVTGKAVMSEIVNHPADGWIIPAIVAIFVLGGAGLGILVAWWHQAATKVNASNG